MLGMWESPILGWLQEWILGKMDMELKQKSDIKENGSRIIQEEKVQVLYEHNKTDWSSK